MPREKIMKTNQTTLVDMEIVKRLRTLRDSINQQSKATKLFCNLYPDINKKVCLECPGKKANHKIAGICFNHEMERNYIHDHEELKGNQRRERKRKNFKRCGEISLENDFDDDYYDDFVDYDQNNNDEISEKYPCGRMYFACPNNIGCEYGEKCTYTPE